MTHRIVLLGFMACGKTTVGQELARQLERKFIDLDAFITESHGRSAAEIIERDGEESFREIETSALRDVLQDKETSVIALGGGTWTIPENRTLIGLHDCDSVWLDTPFDICWERIESNLNLIRPMAPDRDTAQQKYNERRTAYELSEMHLATAGFDVKGIVSEIGKRLRHTL